MESTGFSRGSRHGGLEGPCVVNNAEGGAAGNVERDRNERTTRLGKGSSEDNEGNVSATGFFRSEGHTAAHSLSDFRHVDPETEPVASVYRCRCESRVVLREFVSVHRAA